MRILREANLLTKHGRGVAAARMTHQDAAYVLVALAGAKSWSDVLRQVERFSAARLSRSKPLQSGAEGLLSIMPSGDANVVDALAEFIGYYVRGDVDSYFDAHGVAPSHRSSSVDVVLSLDAPVQALFRIVRPGGGVAESCLYKDTSKEVGKTGDLRTFQKISGYTFALLAHAFNAAQRRDIP